MAYQAPSTTTIATGHLAYQAPPATTTIIGHFGIPIITCYKLPTINHLGFSYQAARYLGWGE